MTIETKKLEISEELKRNVEMVCRFAYVDYTIINGNIKSIKNTNIAFVKPHIVKIKNTEFLIFDNCDDIFINNDKEKIKFKDLEKANKKSLELKQKEEQDLIMSYIESIEVIKKDDKIEIKNINFRKTFIEEYANLFNNGGLSVYQEILMNDEKIQVEASEPMTRKDAHEYIKRLQYNYSVIDYHEVPKENSTNNKFTLKYQRENILYEPMKIIPLLNKKGITKITHYGIIEIPIVHSTFIKI